MIAKKIRIVLSRQRRVTTSVCLRAEVYGCEIPRGKNFNLFIYLFIYLLVDFWKRAIKLLISV